MDKLCFIDFETTGVNLYEDYPIQLGAILVEGPQLVCIKEFTSRIRPPEWVTSTPEALMIHGISNSQLTVAPTAAETLHRFFGIMGTDFCFAGWNICFDVGFFKRLCHESGMDSSFSCIRHRHLDVQSIVQYLRIRGTLPQHLTSLKDISSHFGIQRGDKHDAMEDARITWLVCRRLLELDNLNDYRRP